MHRHEWIITDGAILKTDCEHHNFGSGELNIVDPEYDLAAAAFELRLSEEAEAALLSAYAEGSGDRAVGARLLLYKLLYGVVTMREAVSQRPVDARQNDRSEEDTSELQSRLQLGSPLLLEKKKFFSRPPPPADRPPPAAR